MSVLSSYERYICGIMGGSVLYDFADKGKAVNQHIAYFLNRTQKMFEWSGLPDTIPQRSLELYLQINGNCAFAEWDDKLYVFTGGMGGEPNPYYMPTTYVVANPALKMSKMYTIDDDCIVCPNDSLYIGLMPMLRKYATMLAEIELTTDIANVNSRIATLLSATDDRTKQAAEKYLADLREGKQGVIADKSLLENGIKAQPYAQTGYANMITNLIELQQYVKASLYNELGLNANYNMKRESLNSEESQLNNDALLPFVDDMLTQRQIAAEKVNAMFGTDISVKLSSAWEDNAEEIELEHEAMEKEGGEDREMVDGQENPE